MQEADARASRFDDETRLLDGPLTIPTRRENNYDAPLANLFFRPPKGITKAPDKAPAGDIEYRYPRTGKGVCSDVYLAFGAADDPQALEQKVEAWLHVPPPEKGWNAKVFDPPGRKPLTFEEADFSDPQSPQLMVYHAAVHGPSGVAVVFRLERAGWEAAREALRLSLESFAVGPEAQRLRAAYVKRAAH
jgi:hypothetical protein